MIDLFAVDVRAELVGLLEQNGVDYVEDAEGARFSLAGGGRVWDVACRCCPTGVCVCCIFPFELADIEGALSVVGEANAELLRGCVYLEGAVPVARAFAEMTDAYTARGALKSAIEYAAAITLRYYAALSAFAAH